MSSRSSPQAHRPPIQPLQARIVMSTNNLPLSERVASLSRDQFIHGERWRETLAVIIGKCLRHVESCSIRRNDCIGLNFNLAILRFASFCTIFFTQREISTARDGHLLRDVCGSRGVFANLLPIIFQSLYHKFTNSRPPHSNRVIVLRRYCREMKYSPVLTNILPLSSRGSPDSSNRSSLRGLVAIHAGEEIVVPKRIARISQSSPFFTI